MIPFLIGIVLGAVMIGVTLVLFTVYGIFRLRRLGLKCTFWEVFRSLWGL